MEIINTLSQFGFTPLNIVLIIMMYSFGVKLRIFPRPRLWKNGNGNGASKAKKEIDQSVPHWAQDLLKHHNHEQTEQNARIIEGLGRIEGTLNKLVTFNETVKEFGVKMRKE